MVGVFLGRGGIARYVGGDDVVGDNVAQELEPEKGNLGEYTPLVGNAGGQHIVEGKRDAIGGDEK